MINFNIIEMNRQAKNLINGYMRLHNSDTEDMLNLASSIVTLDKANRIKYQRSRKCIHNVHTLLTETFGDYFEFETTNHTDFDVASGLHTRVEVTTVINKLDRSEITTIGVKHLIK